MAITLPEANLPYITFIGVAISSTHLSACTITLLWSMHASHSCCNTNTKKTHNVHCAHTAQCTYPFSSDFPSDCGGTRWPGCQTVFQPQFGVHVIARDNFRCRNSERTFSPVYLQCALTHQLVNMVWFNV